MAKINVLGFDVANLIAAGEVVDRPASVVKELLENALDAGATQITAEIRKGGIASIRVSDNGCGMDAEDLTMSVLRHATSKIVQAEDLDGITTLGFRGEALAAISSVSRMRIYSKVPGAEFGSQMICEGGSVVSVSESGCAPGTTVIVEDLFFNVPARRKFLKKDSTETVAITAVMEKLALSKPEVSFKYVADGEVRFITAGDGDLHSTVYALFGRDTASRTIKVNREEGGIRVWGCISEPDNVRSNRNMENFFINGRYVKSRTAAAALEQAYKSRIPQEKFPFCVLHIEVNPAAVDVNVHPAKLEVKFSNERVIFDAVYYAVLGALTSAGSRPELTLSRPAEKKMPEKSVSPFPSAAQAAARRETESRGNAASGQTGIRDPYASPLSDKDIASAGYAPRQDFWTSEEEARRMFAAFVPMGGEPKINAVRDQVKIPAPANVMPAAPAQSIPEEEKESDAIPEPIPAADVKSDANRKPETKTAPIPETEIRVAEPEESPEEEASQEKQQTPPDYVIVGEAFNCYIIVQMADRLILIDKHAAHERILFDELCANMKKKAKTAQVLLFPVEISMTEEEIAVLEEFREKIEAIGFSFRCGERSVSVSAVPTEITREAAADMMGVLAGRLADGTGSVESTEAEFFEARLYQASCKAAIKGGRVYSLENIKWLCDRLLCDPGEGSAIKTCPHGRPVAFELRKSSIERQFSRLV
ncbi:MAG: DNA mismatch repair endonuclease MutL [Ruminococcaceae bacterium]|nr:DNA mismatch repair endonuclease MutL [Oscillospiraceae bacterium]